MSLSAFRQVKRITLRNRLCPPLLIVVIATSLAGGVSAGAATDYVFSTWAGSTESVVKSADGDRTHAQFDSPRGVAVDRARNIFVADTANNTIRRITPEGAVTTVAGTAGTEGRTNGTGSAARFTEPFGLAVDANGTLYVADASNNVIRRVTSDGTVSTLAGNGASGSSDGPGSSAQFDEPRAVAVDQAGTVYVADYDNHTIRQITATGRVTTLAGRARTPGSVDGSGETARFRDPMGIAVDAAGIVYVADSGNRSIRRIDRAGVVTTLALTGEALSDPRGIAIGSDGELVVADYGAHTVRIVATDGRVRTLAGQRARPGTADGYREQGRFHYPFGVAVDADGTVLVADSENDTIRAVGGDGEVTTIAGVPGRTSSVDGGPDEARFEDPFAIAADARAVSYVADSAAHVIRRIAGDGSVTTLAGLAGSFGSRDGLARDARFYSPYGVAVDAAGHVYVADSLNSTVRKVTPDGQVSTLAGAAGERGNRDGRGPDARLDQPFGIAVGADGTVYVSDATSNTIRRITPDGTVSTLAGLAGAAGATDGMGAQARFTVPYGIGVDANGVVYVADHGNHTIRLITAAGVVTTLAGRAGVAGYADGHGGDARFRFPSHLAVTASGVVFVADTDNHAIRQISPSGSVSTIGGGGAPGALDGAGSAARFFNPKGIAVADAATVYVADRSNHTIRRGVVDR